MPLLDVKGLVKSYSGRRVVDGVDLHVNQGEIVGLLGPNGAGKTTTFRMVMGMIPNEAGKVTLNNEDISESAMFQRARKGMGYLAQEPSIFRRMTVEDNIMAILETLPISKRERIERLAELLSNLSLTRLSQNMADTLSGGERRRLEITRALVIEPTILLLDEPFSGVDPKAVAEIQKIIAALRAGGMSILLTDHNVWETLTITDRAYIIHEGKVLIHGTAEQLIHDPEAQRLYLGDRFAAVQESFSKAKEKIEATSHAQHAGLRMRKTTRIMKKTSDSARRTLEPSKKKPEEDSKE
jgi:lipopolysaccharide export system ATP-binding protein